MMRTRTSRRSWMRGSSADIGYDALNRVSTHYTNDPESTHGVYKYDAQALKTGFLLFRSRHLIGYWGRALSGRSRDMAMINLASFDGSADDGTNYAVDATYDLAGETKTEIYPAVPGFADRRTVSFSYNTAGRMSSISSAATSYAAAANVSSMTYSAHGGLASETYGSGLIHATTTTETAADRIKLGTRALLLDLDIAYTYSDRIQTSRQHGKVGRKRSRRRFF